MTARLSNYKSVFKQSSLGGSQREKVSLLMKKSNSSKNQKLNTGLADLRLTSSQSKAAPVVSIEEGMKREMAEKGNDIGSETNYQQRDSLQYSQKSNNSMPTSTFNQA